MDINEKADMLQEHRLCDHCFGRQFARLGHGLENWERSLIIKELLDEGIEIDEDDIDRDNLPDTEPSRTKDCEICGGLFQQLESFTDRLFNALERYDFDTYLVGTRPPQDVVDAEEQLWEETGLQWVEPIKSELNRLLGKRLEARLDEERDMDTTVDFERADVNPVLDIGKDRVEVQVNSVLVHGFYNKLARGLPQTKWPCNNCQGKGCDECDWTGKQYQDSVEELIAEPFIEATKGLESKFHGAGREDVDARCLGKREFVLEITEPQQRDLDLEELQQRINEEHGNKVEVFGLEPCGKDLVETVKSRDADKTYRAQVELEDAIDEDDLQRLEELVGTVEQRTPTRVEHRRADKTREREVHDIDWEYVDEYHIVLEVKGEAGLYIKELISGDQEKTEPSVSHLLDTVATCTELDVIDIEKPPGYEDV
ncbi:MAG: tRNA pseudouridine(54/55) synthase Pus10 [Candidatus Nanohaloarchaea archaeon]|nr:tRNA pseudouridine(54/55) synthase Pus10 [Candidatus Nanohaloarchaea archaeon]